MLILNQNLDIVKRTLFLRILQLKLILPEFPQSFPEFKVQKKYLQNAK